MECHLCRHRAPEAGRLHADAQYQPPDRRGRGQGFGSRYGKALAPRNAGHHRNARHGVGLRRGLDLRNPGGCDSRRPDYRNDDAQRRLVLCNRRRKFANVDYQDYRRGSNAFEHYPSLDESERADDCRKQGARRPEERLAGDPLGQRADQPLELDGNVQRH